MAGAADRGWARTVLKLYNRNIIYCDKEIEIRHLSQRDYNVNSKRYKAKKKGVLKWLSHFMRKARQIRAISKT